MSDKKVMENFLEMNIKAAEKGDLETIIKKIEDYKNLFGIDWWNESIAHVAATYNHKHIIDWIVKNNLSIDENTFNIAIKYGRIEILEKLKNYNKIWNGNTLCRAINSAHPSTVEWLLNNGCPYDENLIKHLKYCEDIKLHEYIVNRLFKENNIANENLFTRKMCVKAIVDGNLKRLEFEMEEYNKKNGESYWDCFLFRMAVYNSRTDIVEWLVKKNYKLTLNDFNAVAETGQHELFHSMRWQFFRKGENCIWNHSTVKKAALNKRYNTLKYLVEMGCPYFKEELIQFENNDEKIKALNLL